MQHVDIVRCKICQRIIFRCNILCGRYFDVFWPRAMRIAEELRAGGHNETYTYTTFSWLISLFFSCDHPYSVY